MSHATESDPQLSTVRLSQPLHRSLVLACRMADRRKLPCISVGLVVAAMAALNVNLGITLGLPPIVSSLPKHLDGESDTFSPLRMVGPTETLRGLREAHWEVFGLSGRRFPRRRRVVPGWSVGVREALDRACGLAQADGRSVAGQRDLLHAMLVPLVESGQHIPGLPSVGPQAARRALAGLWTTLHERPSSKLASHFLAWNIAEDPAQAPSQVRGSGFMLRFMNVFAESGPLLVSLELEAVRQAVRLGHGAVTQAHLLLAVLALEDQLTALGLRMRSELRAYNAPILTSYPYAVTMPAAVAAAVAGPTGGDLAGKARRRAWRTHPENPPWLVSAAAAAEQVRAYPGTGRNGPGSVHLLHAMLQVPDESLRVLLHRLGVNPAQLLGQTQRHLASISRDG